MNICIPSFGTQDPSPSLKTTQRETGFLIQENFISETTSRLVTGNMPPWGRSERLSWLASLVFDLEKKKGRGAVRGSAFQRAENWSRALLKILSRPTKSRQIKIHYTPYRMINMKSQKHLDNKVQHLEAFQSNFETSGL